MGRSPRSSAARSAIQLPWRRFTLHPEGYFFLPPGFTWDRADPAAVFDAFPVRPSFSTFEEAVAALLPVVFPPLFAMSDPLVSVSDGLLSPTESTRKIDV